MRGIPQSEVKARLDGNINFRVQQGSDGEFSLQECGGLDGGVPPETIKAAAAGIIVGGLSTGLNAAYHAFQPDIDKQNKKIF